jgi:hypothetical protein
MITYHTENCYRLSVRKNFLLIFKRWIPLTYQVTENSNEEPIEFHSFLEAETFINNIAD